MINRFESNRRHQCFQQLAGDPAESPFRLVARGLRIVAELFPPPLPGSRQACRRSKRWHRESGGRKCQLDCISASRSSDRTAFGLESCRPTGRYEVTVPMDPLKSIHSETQGLENLSSSTHSSPVSANQRNYHELAQARCDTFVHTLSDLLDRPVRRHDRGSHPKRQPIQLGRSV